MRILSYSPSVEVYVETVGKGGAKSYYDLSADVTRAVVTRNVDTNSTFDIVLQNEGGKYNGKFSPMDKVTVFMSKDGDRVRMISGYINTVSVFTLYPADFTISGSCTIYQLKKKYWDPYIEGSFRLMSDSHSSNAADWGGWSNVIWKLMGKVAGWDMSQVLLSDVPTGIVEKAQEIYASQLEDVQVARGMAEEFYNVLQTSGPQLGGNGSGDGSGIPVYTGTASVEAVEAAVQWMIAVANDNSHGYAQGISGHQPWGSRLFDPDIDCSSFVYFALVKNGWGTKELGTYPFGTSGMSGTLPKAGWRRHDIKSYDELQRGDILLKDGHTEMYIGGGQTVGAHSDYDGRPGDSSGKEVSVVSIASGWKWYFRFEG